MGMIIRKRQLLMATLVVALGAAVFVNWYYTKPETSTTGAQTETTTEKQANLGDSLYVQGTTAPSDESENSTEEQTETYIATVADTAQYFADAKLKRTQAHDEILDAIEEIAESDDAGAELVNKANIYLKDFQESVKLESDLENLITAKTGLECLVSINNGNAQIVTVPGKVDSTVTLQITELINKHADITSENISIIEAK